MQIKEKCMIQMVYRMKINFNQMTRLKIAPTQVLDKANSQMTSLMILMTLKILLPKAAKIKKAKIFTLI
jgi:hypothetical protein